MNINLNSNKCLYICSTFPSIFFSIQIYDCYQNGSETIEKFGRNIFNYWMCTRIRQRNSRSSVRRSVNSCPVASVLRFFRHVVIDRIRRCIFQTQYLEKIECTVLTNNTAKMRVFCKCYHHGLPWAKFVFASFQSEMNTTVTFLCNSELEKYIGKWNFFLSLFSSFSLLSAFVFFLVLFFFVLLF